MMMNNQNTSGTENVSNNNLNPPVNPENTNVSEKPDINSILNGTSDQIGNTSENLNSESIPKNEPGVGNVPVQATQSVVDPSLNNNPVVPTIESIPQSVPEVGSVPVQATQSVVDPSSNNNPVVPTIESIPQTVPEVGSVPVQTTQAVVDPSSNNNPVVPTIESIPQSVPEVGSVSVQTIQAVVDPSSNNNPVVPTIESIPQSGPEVGSVPVQTTQAVVDPSLNNNPVVPTIGSIPQSAPVQTMSTGVDSMINTSQVSSVNDSTNISNPAVNQMNGMANAINSTVFENQMPTTTPSNDNEFNAIPQPPVFEEEPKKKNKGKFDKKILIVVLIVILIAAIGFGVYYFLTSAKSTATRSIVTNDLKLELGQTLSQNVEDYAKITGYKKESCTLDLSNVSTSNVSTYKYYVKCENEKKEGTIIVDDTTAPQLILNDLAVLPNAQIKPEDFVEQCVDASNCSYKFNGDYQAITKEVGEYDIEIEASDDFNNKTVLKAKLTVTLNAPVKYMTCTSKEMNLESGEGTYVDSYKIGIDASNNFLNAKRISQFNYRDEASYNNATQNYEKSIGINNIIGTESFSQSTKTITLKSDKNLKDIESDLDGTLSKNMSLFSIYMEGYGYTCK